MSLTDFWNNITTPGAVRQFAQDFTDICDDFRKEMVQIIGESGKEILAAFPDAVEETVEIVTTGSLDPVKDSVPEPALGNLVYCTMRGVLSRTGVYLGARRIAFVDEFGDVEAEDPRRFVMNVETLAHPRSIFVACNGTKPTGGKKIAERALEWVGRFAPADEKFAGGHEFVLFCLTGERRRTESLTAVKRAVAAHLDVDAWRRWDLGDELAI